MYNLLLIIASVLTGAFGQIFLKAGALKINESALSGILKFTNFSILFGFLFYGLSSLIWIFVLRKVQLSYAYPFVSLGYIVVFIASYFLFHETISLYRSIGITLILIGILFIARS